jgi:SAM-dependent methyltransferase
MSWESLTAAQQDHLLRRPFDHFARYRLAAEVVCATAGPHARVLDLGGGPGTLQQFLPQADVTSTDLVLPGEWHEQAPSLVLADGAALPFADDSFDVVVSLDTLEHVVPASREAFLREVGRVASAWGFVVCPYATPGVADADTALRAYVAARFAPDLPTIRILDEHLGYGHPDLEASRAVLADSGPVADIPSGRLDRWLAGMLTFFHLLAIGDDEPVEVVQRFLNRNLYEADLAGPAYRHGLLVRTAAEGPDPQAVLAPLVARGAVAEHAAADLDLLRIVLTESLTESTRSSTARAAQATAAAATATAEADQARAAAEAAEEQLHQAMARVSALEAARADDARAMSRLQAAHDELAGFRDRVLGHPVMRGRDVARRLLGR